MKEAEYSRVAAGRGGGHPWTSRNQEVKAIFQGRFTTSMMVVRLKRGQADIY